MTATPQTKVTVTISIIGSLIIFGWWGSAAFGSKADKSEIDPIREELQIIKRERAVDAEIQKNILKLLEKMDNRMERIENKQDWQIQENLKRWQGNMQPPASTPSPNTLNR